MDYCPRIGRDPEVPIVQDPEGYIESSKEDDLMVEGDEAYGIEDPDYIEQLGMDGFQSEMLEEENQETVADGGLNYEHSFDYLGSSEIPLGEFGDGN
ncbi:MAG: hypothetical protein H8Z69_02155 [Nanohaloarchaea archaeon]|nr:hypothetical protein [Candidatus Nanohaloarchaea archaeon]